MTTPNPSPQPVPAGWYPDPALFTTNETGDRYWDGTSWTQQTRASLVPTAPVAVSTEPIPSPTGAAYATWWQRGAGYIIDSLIFVPFYIGLGILFIVNLVNDPTFIDLMDTAAAGSSYSADSMTMDEQTAIINAMIDSARPLLIWYLLLLAITAVYWIICIAIWGRTVGGAAMGIKAVNSDGNVPGFAASTIRYGVIFGFTILSSLVQFIPYAGSLLGTAASGLLIVCFLSMLWNSRRQAWQDKAAGTYVVQTREKKTVTAAATQPTA